MEELSVENIERREEAEDSAKHPLNKKWLLVGLLIAVFNPVFAGLILGAAYLSETSLKREGLLVTLVSVVWGAFLFFYFRNKIPGMF